MMVFPCKSICIIIKSLNMLNQTYGSSGDVVVKLLACEARGPGSISSLAATISEIVYLMLAYD